MECINQGTHGQMVQCILHNAQESNFTYEVIFLDEEEILWWHAHSDWTWHSVHGAIVILPKEETGYPFQHPDGEEILVCSEVVQT